RPGSSRVRAAEDSQGQPTDRSGDASAVVLESFERGIGHPAYVSLAAIDEIAERLKREREPVCRGPQGNQHVVTGRGPIRRAARRQRGYRRARGAERSELVRVG